MACYEYTPAAVLKDLVDIVAGQRMGVARIVQVLRELVAVVTVEPVFGGHPDHRGAIFEYMFDQTAGESVFSCKDLIFFRTAQYRCGNREENCGYLEFHCHQSVITEC